MRRWAQSRRPGGVRRGARHSGCGERTAAASPAGCFTWKAVNPVTDRLCGV